MDSRFQREVLTACQVIQSLKEAGVHEDDPDFFELVENESDVLAMLRDMYRRARLEEAEAQAAKEVAKEIANHAARREAKAETLKGIILQTLSELGQKRLEAPEFTLSIVPGSIGIRGELDPEKLPDHLVRIKREPDKTAIKAALQAGEIVEGVYLGNGAPHLRVTK